MPPAAHLRDHHGQTREAPAGVDRRGHFQSVGDITTQQIFGLKRSDGIDADDMHVPLMAVPHDQDNTSYGSESDPDIWNADEPDAAMLDSWASLGFSASLCASPVLSVHGTAYTT
jgi:hypothetical protein